MSVSGPADASGDLRTTRRDDASLGDLFSEMTSELSQLFHQEVELAKVEIKDEATRAGRGVGMLSGTAVAALLALLMLSFAAAWGLAEVMPTAVGFLIVAVPYVIAAAVLYGRGRRELEQLRPPEKTIQTLKEDASWARAQKN